MTSPQTSGLARWREKQAEQKRLTMEELEMYRQCATTEIRDGREFKVVRIPDRYDFTRLSEPSLQFKEER